MWRIVARCCVFIHPIFAFIAFQIDFKRNIHLQMLRMNSNQFLFTNSIRWEVDKFTVFFSAKNKIETVSTECLHYRSSAPTAHIKNELFFLLIDFVFLSFDSLQFPSDVMCALTPFSQSEEKERKKENFPQTYFFPLLLRVDDSFAPSTHKKMS